MKGRLLKANDQWLVTYNDAEGLFQILPLHPYDIQEIEDQAKVFDNIEARISVYPDIHFEIELFWETGIEVPFDVAKLKTKCYCGHTNICDCGPENHNDLEMNKLNNMEIQEVIDKNIVIGNFVGTKEICGTSYYCLPTHTIEIFGYGAVDIDKPEELKYHRSYDWIMPVVLMIEREYSVSIIEDECEIMKTGYESWSEVISRNEKKILAIWDAVYQFIVKKNKGELKS